MRKIFNKIKRDGFLLFEVMVAIIICSTVIVVLLQGLSNALRSSDMAKDYFKASILAEGQLALSEKESGVKRGRERGKFTEEDDPDGIFSFEKSINLVRSGSLVGIEDLPICDVLVKVFWKKGQTEKSISFETHMPKYEEGAAPER